MPRSLPAAALAALAFLVPAAARAQDPFEIQVYEYETVPKGRWNLETHYNYTFRGTTEAEGRVSPTRHQHHLTFELTRGITNTFELAGYLVFATRPGEGAEIAGYRVRPRVMVPKAWHWPVGVSLSVEVGFPKAAYEENSVTFELRPIIEKNIGRLQLDLNPTLGRSLDGPGSGDGWDFEPGGRVGFAATKALDLSVEYYGSLGRVDRWLPAPDQVHQFFLGGDAHLSDDVVLNLGWGVGATSAGNRSVLKMRLGWLF